MKVGVRKPSIKRSIKARTTGRIKREMKSAVNPFYGKKGMGWVKDPEKALYNKDYHKTTVGVPDMAKVVLSDDSKNKKQAGKSTASPKGNNRYVPNNPHLYGVICIVLSIIEILLSLLLLLAEPFMGILGILVGIYVFMKGRQYIKIGKSSSDDQIY